MKKNKFIQIISCLLMTANCIFANQASPNEIIWQKKPGDINKNWEGQVFNLGNGWFGASAYGGIKKEVFALAEKTFWSSGPGDGNSNTYGILPFQDANALEELKKVTRAGDFHKADAIMSRNYRSSTNNIGFQSTIGQLFFEFNKHASEAKNYTRSLNLENSTTTISYEMDGVKYSREYFCSYPDRVLAMRLKTDKANKLNFKIGMNLAHIKRNPKTTIDAKKGLFIVEGNIDDNNRPYVVKIKIINKGGTLSKQDDFLLINNANEVTVYYTVATNYKSAPPLYKGNDPYSITNSIIDKVAKDGYDVVKERHIKDYQSLYKKTKLTLENPVKERLTLPTDERLAFYIKKDYRDIALKELAFNFGKYIMISASREKTLIVGLQGAWNNYYSAPWWGTIQLGVNVPLTYTYSNTLNLHRCQEPIIDFTKERAVIGKELAKNYYNSNGWTSFIITDIWGHAGLLATLDLKFVSSAWLSLIIWEQYAYTQDKKYLAEIYPILKGASEFFLENLIEYKDSKKLVFYSTASNEHRTELGSCIPNFQDIGLISELFENTIKAAEILNLDKDFRNKVAESRANLMPYKIGKWGQMQEWVEDLDDDKCQHRHISQTLALFPGNQINLRKDKKMLEAIKITLEKRGDADNTCLDRVGPNSPEMPSRCTHEGYHFDNFTGQVWCRAIRLSTYLRVYDPEKANKIFNDIFAESTLDNMIQYETKKNYSANNTETPYFLDGTVMSAGYIAEMLLQSQNDELDLLPALPKEWKTGSLKGICARNNIIVDIEWKDNKLVKAIIKSDITQNVNVRYDGKVKSIKIIKGEDYSFKN